jgi:hypothetical protein
MITTQTAQQALLQDPTTSSWLKRAHTTALERDPVDALRDAQTLVQLLEQHLKTVQTP